MQSRWQNAITSDSLKLTAGFAFLETTCITLIPLHKNIIHNGFWKLGDYENIDHWESNRVLEIELTV